MGDRTRHHTPLHEAPLNLTDLHTLSGTDHEAHNLVGQNLHAIYTRIHRRSSFGKHRLVNAMYTVRGPDTINFSYSSISWDRFQQILEVAGRLRPITKIPYYTGMRPSEVFDLEWKEVDFSRRMIVLPPARPKEGKNLNQKILRDKRVPMHREVHDLL